LRKKIPTLRITSSSVVVGLLIVTSIALLLWRFKRRQSSQLAVEQAPVDLEATNIAQNAARVQLPTAAHDDLGEEKVFTSTDSLSLATSTTLPSHKEPPPVIGEPAKVYFKPDDAPTAISAKVKSRYVEMDI
jgi:hypothetical protein